MVPKLVDNQIATGRKSRHTAPGLQLVNRSKVNSLNAYKRSYLGTIHSIWAKIPQDIIKRRQEFDWKKSQEHASASSSGKTMKTNTGKNLRTNCS